ncbi:MAG: ribosome-associated translation inhibitor RaiA [Bacteroidales bacterium]|nr:MAG: ribosome-associated translation inhibitor RaiA [Bacteroidales bacterium]
MNVKIQSIKFTADKKLIDFINQKVNKLERFFDNIIDADVYLRADKPQEVTNKTVEIRLNVPGTDLFVHKQCSSFEEAVDECIAALKIQIKKHKEKIKGV